MKIPNDGISRPVVPEVIGAPGFAPWRPASNPSVKTDPKRNRKESVFLTTDQELAVQHPLERENRRIFSLLAARSSRAHASWGAAQSRKDLTRGSVVVSENLLDEPADPIGAEQPGLDVLVDIHLNPCGDLGGREQLLVIDEAMVFQVLLQI